MLLQAQRTKGAQGVDGENLPWRSPIRKAEIEIRDQPANEVRVAVAAIVQDRLAVGSRSRVAFQPYLTDAAPRTLLLSILEPAFAKGLEGMTEFDDIAIAILPIVEKEAKCVTDGFKIQPGQSTRICTRLLIASEPDRSRSGRQKRPSPHQSPSPGFSEKNWNLSGFPSQSLEVRAEAVFSSR